jgi:MFS family permease
LELKSFVPDRVSTHAKIFLSAAALNGLGNGMINVVFQLYLISLGFDSAAIGAMVMMNPLGAAILTVPAGILADRYGKKKMMVFGFFMICVSLFIILFARTYELFAICFFMIGLSNATFVVLTPLYSSFFEKDDMDRAFGLWGFLNILTMSLGNLVGWVPPMLVKNLGVSVQHSYWVVIAVAGVVVLVQTPLYLLSLRGAVEPESNNGFRLMIKSKGIIAKFFLLSVVSMVSGNVFFNLFTYYTNSKFGVESVEGDHRHDRAGDPLLPPDALRAQLRLDLGALYCKTRPADDGKPPDRLPLHEASPRGGEIVSQQRKEYGQPSRGCRGSLARGAAHGNVVGPSGLRRGWA